MTIYEKPIDPLHRPYLTLLKDGYLQPSPERQQRRPKWSRPEQAYEEVMAEHLFRLGKEMHRPWSLTSERDRPVPNPLHVWILGSDEPWIDAASDDIKDIASSNKNLNYRIVVIGADVATIQSYIHNWSDWIAQAGMIRSKRHADRQQFRELSFSLLDMLAFRYTRTRAPPTDILRDLNVPVTYFGG